MEIHLVDGTYELFRAFYGVPPAYNSEGEPVGAARGLLRSLISLLHEPGTRYIAVAFDHVIESFRNEIFDGYKTGEGMEPELAAQFELAEEVTRALGVVVWPMIEFEADDAIATGAARFGASKRVTKVFLTSPDKDLAQCVQGERIVMLDRMRDRVIDEAGVHEKWGIAPSSIPDLLALMGDTADGIPGIPRWGAKSCAKVLSTYHHIDQIPEDPEEWTCTVRGAAGLARNLNEAREEAALYKELATLRTDVPIEEELDDLKWRGADRTALTNLCERMGETAALQRIRLWRSP